MKQLKFKKIIALFMIAMFIMSIPVETNAKTTTVNTSTDTLKPKTLTKTGTYKLNLKGDLKFQYIVFKAPKAGTYKFSLSDLSYKGEKDNMKKDDYLNEYNEKYGREIFFCIQQPDGIFWKDMSFNVNGKKEDMFYMSNTYKLIVQNYWMSNYDSILDTALAISSGEISEEEAIKNANGNALDYYFTVKMKKGSKVQFKISGDKRSSNLKFKVSTVKK